MDYYTFLLVSRGVYALSFLIFLGYIFNYIREMDKNGELDDIDFFDEV
jgi:hypothetical protein